MKHFPWYIMRTNPISYRNMEEFSDDNLVQSIHHYLAQYQAFLSKSKEMVEELEDVFGRTKNNRILNYKRRIYNLKSVQLDSVPEEIIETVTIYKQLFDELTLRKNNLENSFIELENVHREMLWGLFNTNGEITNPLPSSKL